MGRVELPTPCLAGPRSLHLRGFAILLILYTNQSLLPVNDMNGFPFWPTSVRTKLNLPQPHPLDSN